MRRPTSKDLLSACPNGSFKRICPSCLASLDYPFALADQKIARILFLPRPREKSFREEKGNVWVFGTGLGHVGNFVTPDWRKPSPLDSVIGDVSTLVTLD
jgi:hypothetical protein